MKLVLVAGITGAQVCCKGVVDLGSSTSHLAVIRWQMAACACQSLGCMLRMRKVID